MTLLNEGQFLAGIAMLLLQPHLSVSLGALLEKSRVLGWGFLYFGFGFFLAGFCMCVVVFLVYLVLFPFIFF